MGTPFLDGFFIVCGALSIYSGFEVLVLAFTTFQRYNTVYFWAICTCAVGCILFAGGFLDLFYKMFETDGLGATIYRPLVILTIGWYGMVTGFALVLWSRLHIVSVPRNIIRYLKYFIIYNIIFSHFPTTVMTFGANVVVTEPWVFGYSVIEKIQMTCFFIQEFTMGALYMHYIFKLTFEKKYTTIVKQMMVITFLVLVLDVVMLLIEYADLYQIQIMLKVLIYSIKLKMEFFVLSLLAKSLQQTEYHPRSDRYAEKVGSGQQAPASNSGTPSMATFSKHRTIPEKVDKQ